MVLAGADAAETTWNFDNPANRLAPAHGPATMAYFDPAGTGWGASQSQFGKASSLGLPALPGGDADVMAFPATNAGQGYAITHHAASNEAYAGSGLVADYTLVLDVLWPSSSDSSWRAIYQTSPGNTDDAELFVRNQPPGGIGIDGDYHGSVTPDEWHRIVIVVRAADDQGQMHKYIDGTLVGVQGATGNSIDSRWALESLFLLFADQNGETAPGYVSSVGFIDRDLSNGEAAALGGPHADGMPIQESDTFAHAAGMIGHRGEPSLCPENTISSINAAFDRGAVAVEIDIRLSADGVAVLMHDSTVDRTTNGSGTVSNMTVAQLKTLDAGSWFSPQFAGEPVPTLAEALQASAGRGRLMLETKVIGMGAAINQALIDSGLDATTIWPWPGDEPARSTDFQTNIPGLQSAAGNIPANFNTATFDALKAQGVVGFDVSWNSVTAAFVDAAHANGMFVSAYTIVDASQAEQLIGMGVDMIETDFAGAIGSLMPELDIQYANPDPIVFGALLGEEQLNATADIAGSFSYSPPEGIRLLPGIHEIAATFTPEYWGGFQVEARTANILVQPPVPLSFDEWAAGLDIDPAPESDQESDQVINLMEYIFAGDPLVADADKLLPTAAITGQSGNQSCAVNFRLSRSIRDVSVIIQRSADLAGWADLYDVTADPTLGSPLLQSAVDEGSHYEIVIVDPNPVASGGGRAFYRVQARILETSAPATGTAPE